VLITDAMPGAGMPDGDYDLLGQKVACAWRLCHLPDGTIGGSNGRSQRLRAQYDQVGRRFFKRSGFKWLPSIPPGAGVGMTGLGSLQPDKSADLALVDADFECLHDLRVKGKLVYSK
jgi:N-acetylglucosamine-6-phosphate deacetylase